ncbi:uncharacterized protein LOC132047565 [Lycium ferocissimum]|uniref:uncharacterized protein LOC132047565 n=1 Tax=Lycium ferocissimum TaxID=112874 RepID=UPI0028167ABA|nr:uncharacterized protein LOC132047565 [Lycium ferocissimum]
MKAGKERQQNQLDQNNRNLNSNPNNSKSIKGGNVDGNNTVDNGEKSQKENGETNVTPIFTQNDQNTKDFIQQDRHESKLEEQSGSFRPPRFENKKDQQNLNENDTDRHENSLDEVDNEPAEEDEIAISLIEAFSPKDHDQEEIIKLKKYVEDSLGLSPRGKSSETQKKIQQKPSSPPITRGRGNKKL